MCVCVCVCVCVCERERDRDRDRDREWEPGVWLSDRVRGRVGWKGGFSLAPVWTTVSRGWGQGQHLSRGGGPGSQHQRPPLCPWERSQFTKHMHPLVGKSSARRQGVGTVERGPRVVSRGSSRCQWLRRVGVGEQEWRGLEQRARRQQQKTPGEGDVALGGGKLPCKPLSGERVLWGLQVAG